MEKYAKESQVNQNSNSKIKFLLAFRFIEQATDYYHQNNYQATEKLFQHAASFGNESRLFYRRGKNLYYQTEYQSVLAKLNQAIAIVANDEQYYYWRAKNLLN
ncbi:hypothetical protein [Aliikangiella maris]|uniref:Uncharacterized protein n=2 Tax=Aliikangiella maris TaxID=3162458 RepID=A0ABV3MU80_9GAMM